MNAKPRGSQCEKRLGNTGINSRKRGVHKDKNIISALETKGKKILGTGPGGRGANIKKKSWSWDGLTLHLSCRRVPITTALFIF